MKLTSITGKYSLLNKSFIVNIKQMTCFTIATEIVKNNTNKIMYFNIISAPLNDCIQ